MHRHQSYERYVDSSTLSRMQQQYWSTKQAVLKKLGKKDDECIVASDSELDSKLEMFHAVQESCANLMRVLELYQDKLIVLAQEENSIGRFLKECGKQDKTRAGKMMIATGKTLSFTAQKRLELRSPLVRLYQEVETFQVRAITDTFITVEKMEKSRTDYRGNLMWMKDISQQLDPDMNRQLEKFRKVQGHVRKTKVKFDKLKVDTLQKVDLLVASRCNMFSHALVAYQNTLLQFWEKTSKTMTTVAESFKGYQHFEFNMLKELTETSKKLAEETNCSQLAIEDDDGDKDRLIFFEAEYHDEELLESHGGDSKSKVKSESRRKSDSLQNLYNSPAKGGGALAGGAGGVTAKKKSSKSISSKGKENKEGGPKTEDAILLNINETPSEIAMGKALNGGTIPPKSESETHLAWQKDLLTGNPELDDCDKDDLMLLNEILNSSTPGFPGSLMSPQAGSFAHQWTATFGQDASSGDNPHDDDSTPSSFGYSSMFSKNANEAFTTSPGHALGNLGALESAREAPDGAAAMTGPAGVGSSHPLEGGATNTSESGFLPSHLLQMNSAFASSSLGHSTTTSSNIGSSPTSEKSKITSPKKPMSASSLSKKTKKDMSAWFNLFADLDPLGNPDALDTKSNAAEEDRSC